MAGTCPRLVGKSRSGMVTCYAYAEYRSFCTELLNLMDGVEAPTIAVFGRKYLVIEVLPNKALLRIELSELTYNVMESIVELIRSFRGR